VALVVLHLLLDVATSREGFVAGTGNDEAADRVVGIERFYRIEQLGAKLAVYGVEDLRPVERDDADAVLSFHQNVLVCHRLDPPLVVLGLRSWPRGRSPNRSGAHDLSAFTAFQSTSRPKPGASDKCTRPPLCAAPARKMR